MTRRLPLWIAFVLVHAAVGWLGYHLPSQPMGDVYHVYEPWSRQALDGQGIVGITQAWVYPQLALVPMMLAWVFGFLGYTPAWALLVTVVDAVGFAVLTGRARSNGRVAAAWFWLAAILLLGPVAVYRLDAITVTLSVLGCLWLVRRPWLGSALLAVAAWVKVWPAALVAAALIVLRRRGVVVATALLVSLLTLGTVLTLGSAQHALGFVAGQTGRGLQVEAPVSAVYLWQAMLRLPDAAVYYAADIITFEVTGPGVATVVSAMTPLLVLAVGAVAVLGAAKVRRGARFAAVFPALALALVLAFVVFNKVGSPQYMAWLVPPVVLALVLDRRRWAGPAVLVLSISWLTQLVYPILYDALLRTELVAVGVLTLRNALLVVLFAWTVARLAAVPARAGDHRRADAAASVSR